MTSIFSSNARWKGHQWSELNARRLELASGDSALQRHCVRCGRSFVIVESSGECYAVYASAFSFHRLSDEVTLSWTNDPCPGSRMARDDHDRKIWVEQLNVGRTNSRGE